MNENGMQRRPRRSSRSPRDGVVWRSGLRQDDRSSRHQAEAYVTAAVYPPLPTVLVASIATLGAARPLLPAPCRGQARRDLRRRAGGVPVRTACSPSARHAHTRPTVTSDRYTALTTVPSFRPVFHPFPRYPVLAFRSAHAVTLVSQYPFRHVQVVLRLYNSPAEVRITVPYTTVQYTHSAVQCSIVQCSAVQCSAVQYSTVQYSTVQYSTVQYIYSTFTVQLQCQVVLRLDNSPGTVTSVEWERRFLTRHRTRRVASSSRRRRVPSCNAIRM